MSGSECRCAPVWRSPRPNGTCGICGGWLPGEKPRPLPWTHDGKKEGENDG